MTESETWGAAGEAACIMLCSSTEQMGDACGTSGGGREKMNTHRHVYMCVVHRTGGTRHLGRPRRRK